MNQHESKPVSLEDLEDASGGGRRQLWQRIRGSGLSLGHLSKVIAGSSRRDLAARARASGLDTKQLRSLAQFEADLDE